VRRTLPRLPSRRAAAALFGSAYALLFCAACGATPGPERNTASTSTAAAGPVAPMRATNVSGKAAAAASCPDTYAATLGGIAARIYHQAATGRNVGQATHRVTNSAALIAAARAGNAAATRAALNSLLLGQIVRIQVLRGGHVLASAGSGSAVAPVAGTLPGTGGARFLLSTQSDKSYTTVTRQVTGAEVLLLSGSRVRSGTISLPGDVTVPESGPLSVGSHNYQVTSLRGSAYPSGALRIALLVPTGEISCPAGASAAQIRTAVLGRVGERIYEAEEKSPIVAATVRRMERTAAFKSAVARHDVAGTRAAILGFFAAHIHVVRVRVTVGSKLLVDVGGPYALAPVSGTLRQGGRVIGRFVTAIQDDAGYMKLARLFTGAEVLMRVGSKQVMGTMSPGPAHVPDQGTVSYRGREYQAFSFTATAFPSGALRISLLY
jgi:hypothetical protein